MNNLNIKLDDKKLFHPGWDCIYGRNYHHAEMLHGFRYLRPSNFVKFQFEYDPEEWKKYGIGYHGTHPNNVKSIIENGLQRAGSKLKNGKEVKQKNG